MKIIIINGPNLNLTGKREKEVYGDKDFETFVRELKGGFPQIELIYKQSNVEGELINILHDCGADKQVRGVLLNAGGYTHTSVAIADAVAAIDCPVIEVHMSNIFSREDYRHVSYLGKHCVGCISGFGMESYLLGMLKLMNQAN
ncbi:MAG: type II 3-dehydroquinate dehydratase [Salibacteraceae bacterium]